MRVQVAIAIDTTDPRYKRLVRLIEDLGENPHSPIEPDRGDAREPPGSARPRSRQARGVSSNGAGNWNKPKRKFQ